MPLSLTLTSYVVGICCTAHAHRGAARCRLVAWCRLCHPVPPGAARCRPVPPSAARCRPVSSTSPTRAQCILVPSPFGSSRPSKQRSLQRREHIEDCRLRTSTLNSGRPLRRSPRPHWPASQARSEQRAPPWHGRGHGPTSAHAAICAGGWVGRKIGPIHPLLSCVDRTPARLQRLLDEAPQAGIVGRHGQLRHLKVKRCRFATAICSRPLQPLLL